MNYKKYLSEFLGTFLLVFLGTGSVIFSEENNHLFNLLTIATIWGFLVWFLIVSLGKYSGCHINSAVTIVAYLDKKISIKTAFFYLVFQIAGAVLASYFLHLLFPNTIKLGNTFPKGSHLEAFIMEFCLSFGLLIVIMVSSTNNNLQKWAPFFIGLTIFVEILIGGPTTGASMNPARSIGPSIVSGNCSVLYLYLLAPILGMILALYVFNKKMR